MIFDILGYQKANKDYYGDAPLADIAKDVYSRDFAEKNPDFNSWVKSSGIEPHIHDDIKRRVRRAWRDACGVETHSEAAAEELDDFLSSVTSLVKVLYIGMDCPGTRYM